MIHRRLIAIVLILYSGGSVVLAQNPGFAGRDRSICPSGATTIGSPGTCTGCCYIWSPQAGLDDPTKPNPTVSGISVSTNYAVTISDPDGNYTTDDVNVTVYESDLQVWHPNYHLFNTMLDPSQEKLPGVQSFVNWDNDDCDMDFDLEDDEVLGGDNELIKLRVLMTVQLLQRPGRGEKDLNKGPGEYIATLDLADGTQLSGLRFWKSNDKAAGEFSLGDALVLTEVPGALNQYEAYLWIEGTEGHTNQQQVKLFARAIDDVTPACRDGFVAVTVLDIASMEWVGVENGFTGDGKNNSNTLDAFSHPDNVAGVTYQRIFPEKKVPGASSPVKSGATLRINFTTTPVVSEAIYLRPFDIDDPSNETQFVDPNDLGTSGVYMGQPAGSTVNHPAFTADEDNRGGPFVHGQFTWTTNKGGVFSGTGINFVSHGFNIYKIDSGTKKQLDVNHLWVSQKCGDNYRAAVSHEQSYMFLMRNRDATDKHNIGLDCGSTTPIYSHLMSPILTVWRTLHVEYDLMKKPTAEMNQYIIGYFPNFKSDASTTIPSLTSVKQLEFVKSTQNSNPNDPVVIPTEPFKDGSRKYGRFENSRIEIGADTIKRLLVDTRPNYIPGGVSAASDRFVTHGNDNFILFNAPVDITFGGTLSIAIQKNTLPKLGAKILDITQNNASNPGECTIKLYGTGLGSGFSAYNSGMIQIEGGPWMPNIVVIDSVTIRLDPLPTILGNSALKIPIVVKDDDYLNALNTPVPFTQAKTTFGRCYIDVVNDGGGNIMNNEDTIRFSKNINFIPIDTLSTPYSWQSYFTDSTSRFQSRTNFDEDFWGVYLISGWQGESKLDRDPYVEPATRGATECLSHDCNLVSGGNHMMLFHEACRETDGNIGGNITSIERTLAHEMGHAFGLSHGFDYHTGVGIKPPHTCLGVLNHSQMGIMKHEQPYSSLDFIPYHLNIIRSRTLHPHKL